MRDTELGGIAVLLIFLVLIAAIVTRRWLVTRAGGVDICWRRSGNAPGRGWSFGQGRYRDQRLILYRSFSPLPFPALTLQRSRLTLGGRRAAEGTEVDLLPVGSVILRCTDGGNPLEFALSEEAMTGLRSWLESVPPGTRGLRGRPRP